MPDRRSTALARRVIGAGRAPVVLEGRLLPRTETAITAAVLPLAAYDPRGLVITPTEPQREAWTYYKAVGECYYGIGVWLANAVSRCRLVLAERVLGSDDPKIITEGPLAAEIARMGGGAAGQSTMLKRMAVQLSVPGESFLATVDDPITGQRTQHVYSNTELRIVGRYPQLTYQVWTQRAIWADLPVESMVSRVWWPDDEVEWAASSPVLAALPILREIDMYNRYIMAVLTSRAASNGMLLIPDTVSFPVNPNFKDAADPWVAELLDAMSKTIKNPGSASAAFPLPIKVPQGTIEAFRHLTFATELGEKVLDDRTKSIHRLAAVLNLPIEAMEGMGDTSHWNAWQISEDAVKLHVIPPVEVICAGLTSSFLRPLALAAGETLIGPNGGELIVWYDASALYQQPDRSEEAEKLYDRGEISGTALRRESGFDDADTPTDAELKEQVLLKIAMAGGADSMAALSLLVGDPSIALVPTRVTVQDPGQTPDAEPPGGSSPPPEPAAPAKSPPPEPVKTPPAPEPSSPASRPQAPKPPPR